MFTTIEAPLYCPSCGETLLWKDPLLFCNNSSCPAKNSAKVQHFAKTLKIKGLGPANIAKLGLSKISHIYEMNQEEVQEKLNSVAIGASIYAEIQESKKCTLIDLLPAFSVPLIGKTASQKLCEVIDSIYDLNNEVCKEAGLGPKATDNLLHWYQTEFLEELKWLPFSFEVDRRPTTAKVMGVVCISGKLKTFSTKSEAEQVLTRKGYVVKSSLTNDVTHLVNESGIESSKTKKARDRGVSIITNLNQLIGS